MARAMSVALWSLALATALAGGAFAAIYLRQEALIFQPEALSPGHAFDVPGAVEESIEVAGARLSALHLRLPDPKGVVFYLHGNGGSLAGWFDDADFYRRVNYDLFMLDYRGYGKSTGRIRGEGQLRADIEAAWRQVAPRYCGRRTVFFGYSLGTGLAAGLAVREHPDLVILAAPYWSMAELARLHHPLIPGFLLRYRLETFRDVERIAAPVLILHGEGDALIPIAQAERLAAVAARGQLVRIAGAAHNDLERFEQYHAAIAKRLAAL